MQQIIHIFRKDIRRFRLEIVINLGLLAAFAWTEPPSWSPPQVHGHSNYLQYNYLQYYLSSWLAVLVCISWSALVVRIIHEESPVGDRQHWVTRPYEWPKLLAAKTLFVLAAVNGPLLIAQFVLLAVAGFAPLSYFFALSAKDLELLAWIILPMAAVAVVTGGFAQMARALLLSLLFFVGVWRVFSMVPGMAAWHSDSWWSRLPYAALLAGLITVVVRQYALRRTTNARFLLLGSAMTVATLVAIVPYRTLIEQNYPPVSKERMPYRLSLDSGMLFDNRAAGPAEVQIRLPISVGEVTGNTVVQFDAMKVTVEGPDGAVWSSGWQPRFMVLNQHEEPNVTDWWSTLDTEVQISRKFLDRVKDTPVTLHVDAAVTLFHSKAGISITRTENEFEVPGLGRCVIDPQGVRLAWCRTPLRRPTILFVSARGFTRCPAENNGPSTSVSDFISRLSPEIRDFGLSPVVPFTPNLTISIANGAYSICPGVPLNFSRPEFAGRFRVEQEFDKVRLTDYWMGRFAEGNSGGAPGIRAIAH